MEQSGFHLPRAAFAGILLVYGVSGGLNPDRFWLLNGADLAFHEFGHIAFNFLGEFGQFLGGTLMQLAIPAAIAGYFYWQKERYGFSVTLFWVAQNLFNVAVYVGDARSQALPLVGGGIHDWNYLLGRTGLLEHDTGIAGLLRLLGWVLMLLSVGLAVKFSRRAEAEEADEY